MVKLDKLLINLAGKYILSKLEGEEPQRAEKPEIPELGEVLPIVRLGRKLGGVVLILGARESGKTILGYRLAEIIGRPTYAISPEQNPPSGITELALEDLEIMPPPFSTLFLDDIPVYMGSRDYQSQHVQQVEKLIPVVRHKRKIMLIFSSQSSGQSDKWTMDADLVLLKPLNFLYPETERGAVKRLADQVMPIFQQMSERQQQRHCYVFSKGYIGLARVNLPKLNSPNVNLPL